MLDNLTRDEAINYLHHVNRLEVLEAQAALSQLEGEAARTYAQTLITDHQANEEQVADLAESENVELFAFQRSTYEIAAEDALSAFSGIAYDEAFLNYQQDAHERIVRDLQAFSNSVTDPETKALIDQSIPVEQKHADEAGSSGSPEGSTSPTPQP